MIRKCIKKNWPLPWLLDNHKIVSTKKKQLTEATSNTKTSRVLKQFANDVTEIFYNKKSSICCRQPSTSLSFYHNKKINRVKKTLDVTKQKAAFGGEQKNIAKKSNAERHHSRYNTAVVLHSVTSRQQLAEKSTERMRYHRCLSPSNGGICSSRQTFPPFTSPSWCLLRHGNVFKQPHHTHYLKDFLGEGKRWSILEKRSDYKQRSIA